MLSYHTPEYPTTSGVWLYLKLSKLQKQTTLLNIILNKNVFTYVTDNTNLIKV